LSFYGRKALLFFIFTLERGNTDKNMVLLNQNLKMAVSRHEFIKDEFSGEGMCLLF